MGTCLHNWRINLFLNCIIVALLLYFNIIITVIVIVVAVITIINYTLVGFHKYINFRDINPLEIKKYFYNMILSTHFSFIVEENLPINKDRHFPIFLGSLSCGTLPGQQQSRQPLQSLP